MRLKTKPEVGRSKGAFHKRIRLELAEPGVSAVVALVDVYPDYADAAEAKRDLYAKAGSPPNFYATRRNTTWKPGCCRFGVKSANTWGSRRDRQGQSRGS